MSDRELLEQAAKAAGIEVTDGMRKLWEFPDSSAWNPLTNDGDALRLAVKLNLTVESWGDSAFDLANSCCTRTDINTKRERHNSDPYAATRRAIVLAAAEIGKGMV